jgi:hypothetical protein
MKKILYVHEKNPYLISAYRQTNVVLENGKPFPYHTLHVRRFKLSFHK